MDELQARTYFDRDAAVQILKTVWPLAVVQAVAIVVGLVYLKRRRSAT